MPNVCDFGIELLGPERTLREVVELLRPGIEELPVRTACGDFILHLDRVFHDLDSEREHVYLDLWRCRTSNNWFQILSTPDSLSAEEVEEAKRLKEVAERLSLAEDEVASGKIKVPECEHEWRYDPEKRPEEAACGGFVFVVKRCNKCGAIRERCVHPEQPEYQRIVKFAR
jgi:hypothetical protein